VGKYVNLHLDELFVNQLELGAKRILVCIRLYWRTGWRFSAHIEEYWPIRLLTCRE